MFDERLLRRFFSELYNLLPLEIPARISPKSIDPDLTNARFIAAGKAWRFAIIPGKLWLTRVVLHNPMHQPDGRITGGSLNAESDRHITTIDHLSLREKREWYAFLRSLEKLFAYSEGFLDGYETLEDIVKVWNENR